MPLQTSWVEHLFAKLTVRYGAAFMRQYADLDAEHVKADWAEVLDGVSGKSLTYALTCLPSDRPVNALQFRDLCRRSPDAAAPALPAPLDRANSARVAAIVSRLRGPDDGRTPAQRVAANLRRIERENGGQLNPAQRDMLESCERMNRAVEA